MLELLFEAIQRFIPYTIYGVTLLLGQKQPPKTHSERQKSTTTMKNNAANLFPLGMWHSKTTLFEGVTGLNCSTHHHHHHHPLPLLGLLPWGFLPCRMVSVTERCDSCCGVTTTTYRRPLLAAASNTSVGVIEAARGTKLVTIP